MTLLERDRNSPTSWLGDLPVTSRYTFGLAGERFFRAIKDEGKILGTYCHQCEHTYVPATLFCERCLVELDDWVDTGKQGVVHSYTLLFEDVDGSPKEIPEIIAFIQFGDGGLVHRLDDIELEDLEIGLQVEAIFKPQELREGSILDIKYFRPIGVE